MTLSAQVINLIGIDFVYQLPQATCLTKVGKVHKEPIPALVEVRIDAIYAASVKATGTALEAVDLISLTE